MPRNSSSEKKTVQSPKSLKESIFTVRSTTEKDTLISTDGVLTRKSISSTSTIIETSNGWNQHQYDEVSVLNNLFHFCKNHTTLYFCHILSHFREISLWNIRSIFFRFLFQSFVFRIYFYNWIVNLKLLKDFLLYIVKGVNFLVKL